MRIWMIAVSLLKPSGGRNLSLAKGTATVHAPANTAGAVETIFMNWMGR